MPPSVSTTDSSPRTIPRADATAPDVKPLIYFTVLQGRKRWGKKRKTSLQVQCFTPIPRIISQSFLQNYLTHRFIVSVIDSLHYYNMISTPTPA